MIINDRKIENKTVTTKGNIKTEKNEKYSNNKSGNY